jgi:hypothetical protein
MKHQAVPILLAALLSFWTTPARAAEGALPLDFVVLPSPTNAVQFRLYTNASPDAPHLFNTFELEAYSERLLQWPAGDVLSRRTITSPSDPTLHNLLVNGQGPNLDATNSMAMIEEASGPEWRYVAFDASAAYRGRLEKYRRGILFIEPDLFVLYDHVVAKETVRLQMVLHPPAATRLDATWGDLHLDLPKAGLIINAPGRRRDLRSWQRMESPVDKLLPGTVTMGLGPTNKLAEVDLLTVFTVSPGGQKTSYAFKLLLSISSIGARIHRDGLPTLVAFRIDPATNNPSLTGFAFTGPVGVDIFKPKQKSKAAQ